MFWRVQVSEISYRRFGWLFVYMRVVVRIHTYSYPYSFYGKEWHEIPIDL